MGRPRDSKNEKRGVTAQRDRIVQGMEKLGLPPEVVAAFRSLPTRDVVRITGQFQDFLRTYGKILDALFGTGGDPKRGPKPI